MPEVLVLGRLVLLADHAGRARQILDQAHQVLTGHVGQGLADRGLGTGIVASADGLDDPLAQEIDHGGVDPGGGGPLPVQRIVTGSPGRDLGQAGLRIGAHAPQHPTLGERDPLVAEGDPGQAPTIVLGPDPVLDRDSDIGQEGLVEVVAAGHLDDLADLDARGGHVEDEVRDALVLGRGRVGPGQQDAPLGAVGPGRPDLLAVDHVLVAVPLGSGQKGGQVRAGLGLGEQLAPLLGAIEHAGQPALLLGLGAPGQDGRSGPADGDGVVGPLDTGPLQLVVDDQLEVGVGAETPRLGPVGGDVAGLGQLPRRRRWVGFQPGADLGSTRVGRVDGAEGPGSGHGQSCRVSVSRPSRIRPGSSKVLGATMACWVATIESRRQRWIGLVL